MTSLQNEFDHLGSPAVEATLAAAPAAPAVPMPVQAPPPPAPHLVQSNGSSSSSSYLPMLCSISQPWAGGCSRGVTSAPTAGWPDARPMQPCLKLSQSPHLYSGNTSG